MSTVRGPVHDGAVHRFMDLIKWWSLAIGSTDKIKWVKGYVPVLISPVDAWMDGLWPLRAGRRWLELRRGLSSQATANGFQWDLA
jgi:hypothetical protein